MGSELTLTGDMLLVLAVLGLTIFAFVTEIVRIDIAAITIMVLLGLLGVVPGDQLFDGFASNAVIAVIAVIVVNVVNVVNAAAASVVAGLADARSVDSAPSPTWSRTTRTRNC